MSAIFFRCLGGRIRAVFVTVLAFGAQSATGEDVLVESIATIELEGIRLSVYPAESLKLGRYGMAEFSSELIADSDGRNVPIIVLVSEDVSLISIGDKLIVGGRYFEVPKGSERLWMIEGIISSPGIGVLEPKDPPKAFIQKLNDEREDYSLEWRGVKFIAQNSIGVSGSVEMIEEGVFSIMIGEFFLRYSARGLEYRGENFEKVDQGDVVTLDSSGALKVQR